MQRRERLQLAHRIGRGPGGDHGGEVVLDQAQVLLHQPGPLGFAHGGRGQLRLAAPQLPGAVQLLCGAVVIPGEGADPGEPH